MLMGFPTITGFYEVTPVTAAHWLEHNSQRNRRVLQNVVNKYAREMASGAWNCDNGQPIVFGKDGNLYDGQHRLHAIVQSGVTLRLFIYVAERLDNLIETIDTGEKRRASQFIDIPNAHTAASVAKVMLCIESSDSTLLQALQGQMTRSLTPSSREVAQYAYDHYEEVDRLTKAGRSYTSQFPAGVFGAKPAASFMFITKYIRGDGKGEEFLQDVGAQMPMTANAARLKTWLLKTSFGHSRLNATQKTLALFYMFDAEMHGKSPKIIRVPESVADEWDVRLQNARRWHREQS